MATEVSETTPTITKEIKELKETVNTIRYNELVHIDQRLLRLESKLKPPLTTLYLIVAFALFTSIIAIVSLPTYIGWGTAGICWILIVLAGLGIYKTIRMSIHGS